MSSGGLIKSFAEKLLDFQDLDNYGTIARIY